MKKNSVFILVSVFLFFAFISFSCTNYQPKNNDEETVVAPTEDNLVKRGEYLVTIMGCNDCHSPKKMGPNGPEIIPELLLSGYPSERPIAKFDSPMIKEGFAMFYPDLTASAGPWGISFAANLTPDQSGIGTWSEEQFKKALKEGKFKGLDGTRMLLPPMPSANFTDIKDEDVSAIFAYLKSIPAVQNVVPAAVSPADM